MQQTSPARAAGTSSPTAVPKARSGPPANDPVELLVAVEEQVARLADVVLKLSALADRYEDAMGRISSRSRFAAQQARVDAMRAVAERGRRSLTALGRGSAV